MNIEINKTVHAHGFLNQWTLVKVQKKSYNPWQSHIRPELYPPHTASWLHSLAVGVIDIFHHWKKSLNSDTPDPIIYLQTATWNCVIMLILLEKNYFNHAGLPQETICYILSIPYRWKNSLPYTSTISREMYHQDYTFDTVLWIKYKTSRRWQPCNHAKFDSKKWCQFESRKFESKKKNLQLFFCFF